MIAKSPPDLGMQVNDRLYERKALSALPAIAHLSRRWPIIIDMERAPACLKRKGPCHRRVNYDNGKVKRIREKNGLVLLLIF